MSKESKKFTIIIPVYNCEKYLKKTIESILDQTYKNYEIILIDDGSSDGSPKICDEYSEKYNNIKTIHKENEGVSKARNIGLQNSKSDYVCFFDSDDYVEKNFLEYAEKIFAKYNTELLITGFFSEVEIENEISFDIINSDEKNYISKEEIKKDLIKLWDKHMLYNVWNKVYLVDIIKSNNLEFPDYNFGEDMEFNKSYLSCITKIYNSEKPFYHYIKERENSLTAKYNEKLFDIRVNEYYEFNKYFEEQNFKKAEYIEFSSRRFIERVLGSIENICGSNLTKKNKKNEIKKIINNNLVYETLAVAKLKSKKIKIMMLPLKLKSVELIYLMGTAVNKIRKSNPVLFNKLKNKR